jgi:hypothetical protein
MPLQGTFWAKLKRSRLALREIIADEDLLAIASLDQKIECLTVKVSLENPFSITKIDDGRPTGLHHHNHGISRRKILR